MYIICNHMNLDRLEKSRIDFLQSVKQRQTNNSWATLHTYIIIIKKVNDFWLCWEITFFASFRSFGFLDE